MTDTKERIKLFFASSAYLFFYYPIKRVVFPLLEEVYKNSYLFLVFFFLWILSVDCGGLNNAISLFVTKLSEDPGFINFLISPLFIIAGIEVTWLHIIFGAIIVACFFKVASMIYKIWLIIRSQIANTVMVALWCVYNLIGNKEKAMICIKSGTERKQIIIFTVIFVIFCIGLVIYFWFRFNSKTGLILNLASGNQTIVNANTLYEAAL